MALANTRTTLRLVQAPLTTTGLVGADLDFDPKDYGRLALWVSDRSGLASGDAVAGWQDQSGNAKHLQQVTGSKQPLLISGILNGRRVRRTDGSNDYFTSLATG